MADWMCWTLKGWVARVGLDAGMMMAGNEIFTRPYWILKNMVASFSWTLSSRCLSLVVCGDQAVVAYSSLGGTRVS